MSETPDTPDSQEFRIEITAPAGAFVAIDADEPALDTEASRRLWARAVLAEKFGEDGAPGPSDYLVDLLAFVARPDYPDETWLAKWVHLPQAGVEPLSVQLGQFEMPAECVGDAVATDRALRELCGEDSAAESGTREAVVTVETPAGTAYSGFTTYRTPEAPADSLVLGRLVYAWALPGGQEGLVLWSRGEPVRVLAAGADIDELATSLQVTLE